MARVETDQKKILGPGLGKRTLEKLRKLILKIIMRKIIIIIRENKTNAAVFTGHTSAEGDLIWEKKRRTTQSVKHSLCG